jgi:hypothetical protein
MSWLLSNREKPYIDAAKTDVMRTWRKHGFVPPSEQKAFSIPEWLASDPLADLTIRKKDDHKKV